MPDEYEQPCCGNCQHFKDEDFCGIGWCERLGWDRKCSDNCPHHNFTLPE
jgi:hypothetical protein